MASSEGEPADREVDTSEIPMIQPLRPSPRPRSADDGAVVDSELAPDGDDPHPDDPDADLFDDESWNRPRRTNRLTALLLVGLLVICGFIAGVAVQKDHDAGLFPGAGAAAGRNRAGGTGGSTGTAGTGGARAGADGQGRAGAAGEPPGAAAPGDQQAPIVTGTVGTIAGDTITVTGGAPVTVLVPLTATVTTTGLTGLKEGDEISVQGTKGTDGTITATAITSRGPGG